MNYGQVAHNQPGPETIFLITIIYKSRKMKSHQINILTCRLGWLRIAKKQTFNKISSSWYKTGTRGWSMLRDRMLAEKGRKND